MAVKIRVQNPEFQVIIIGTAGIGPGPDIE